MLPKTHNLDSIDALFFFILADCLVYLCCT